MVGVVSSKAVNHLSYLWFAEQFDSASTVSLVWSVIILICQLSFPQFLEDILDRFLQTGKEKAEKQHN